MKSAEDFDAFVAIVDAGSISEASRALGVPRASLSRQLARLETRLGVRLLHRSTRSLVPTPAGEALYPRARSLVDAAASAVALVQRLDDVPRGLVRISSPPLNGPALGELVSAFLHAYPDVTVELSTSTRHIDLAAEQVDLALRGGVVRDLGLIAKPLFRTDMIAVASPAYLTNHGPLTSLVELKHHVCLRGYQGGSRPATTWPLRDGGQVQVDGPFVTNDLMALHGAATSGLGVAFLPRDFVAPEVDRGLLIEVLPGIIGVDVSLSLVWLEREFLDPKVRAFIDLATAWAAAGRLGPGSAGRL